LISTSIIVGGGNWDARFVTLRDRELGDFGLDRSFEGGGVSGLRPTLRGEAAKDGAPGRLGTPLGVWVGVGGG
jgi:hypothetical protein